MSDVDYGGPPPPGAAPTLRQNEAHPDMNVLQAFVRGLQSLLPGIGPAPAQAAIPPQAPIDGAQPPPQAPQAQQPPVAAPARGVQIASSGEFATPPPAAPTPFTPEVYGFQRFTPNRARNSGWGTANDAITSAPYIPGIYNTSRMPAPAEAYPTIYGSGRQLANWGPPSVALPAGIASSIARTLIPMLDLISGGAASPAYGKAQARAIASAKAQLGMRREFYEQERERMLDNAEQAVRNHKAILSEYDEVRDLYTHGGFSKNPAEAERMAREAIKALNLKHNHTNLNIVLDNQGVDAVLDYLKKEDARMLDMWSGAVSLRESDKRREKGGQGADSEFDKSMMEGEGKGGTFTERPPFKGIGEPTGPGPVQPNLPSPTTPAEADAEVAKRHGGLSNDGMTAARDFAEGGTYEGMDAKAFSGKARNSSSNVLAAAEDMKGMFNRATASTGDPSQDTVEEKLKRLEAISPTAAANVRAFGSYERDPNKEFSLNNPMRGFYDNLTKSVYSNYSPNKFAKAQNFTDIKSPINQLMTKVSGLNQGALTVSAGFRSMDENTVIPRHVWNAWKNGHWSGDPQYKQIEAGMQQFNEAMAGISQLTGRPPVTMFKLLQERGGKATDGPRILRTIMGTEMSAAWAHVGNYQHQWEDLNKNALVPGMESSSWRGISAYLRSNWNTGQMPTDAPAEWLAVSKDPKNANKALTPEQKFPPTTAEQARSMANFVKRFRNDPDPGVQKTIHEWEMRLPAVIHPPWQTERPWDKEED